jgi:ankyrin repeat protein
MLIDAGGSLSSREVYERTPLHAAAIHGNLEIVKLLLDHGADMTVMSTYGFTPLHSAALHGQVEVLKLLLSSADVAALSKQQMTPLNVAARYGRAEGVRTLLDLGADVDQADETYGHRSIRLVRMDRSRMWNSFLAAGPTFPWQARAAGLPSTRRAVTVTPES